MYIYAAQLTGFYAGESDYLEDDSSTVCVGSPAKAIAALSGDWDPNDLLTDEDTQELNIRS